MKELVSHEKNGITFRIASSELDFVSAQKLRHDVYLEQGYITNPGENGVIPDLQDMFSEYIVAIAGEEVVGTLRVTDFNPLVDLIDEWSGSLIPDKNDLVGEMMNSNFVIVGALAARKDLSARRISWGIYKSILLLSSERGITHWLIAIDNRVLRTLEMLGWVVEKIGNPIFYMGSLTTLGIIVVEKQLASFAARNKTYYSYIISN